MYQKGGCNFSFIQKKISFSVQISKEFKRAAVSLSKMCRSKIFVTQSDAQLEGEGGDDYLALFQNFLKSALILEKNALNIFACGLNFLFKIKCCFQCIQEKNLRNFFLRSLFLVCYRLNVYQGALILRNLPCPEKFLVTRLVVELRKNTRNPL